MTGVWVGGSDIPVSGVVDGSGLVSFVVLGDGELGMSEDGVGIFWYEVDD